MFRGAAPDTCKGTMAHDRRRRAVLERRGFSFAAPYDISGVGFVISYGNTGPPHPSATRATT
jgi:hypothetical protein